MDIVLTPTEIDLLMKQDPAKEKDGGWQSLLVKLQKKLNRSTGALSLNAKELERIPRYAFDYKNGGWESDLKEIFGRTLGPRLGRQPAQN